MSEETATAGEVAICGIEIDAVDIHSAAVVDHAGGIETRLRKVAKLGITVSTSRRQKEHKAAGTHHSIALAISVPGPMARLTQFGELALSGQSPMASPIDSSRIVRGLERNLVVADESKPIVPYSLELTVGNLILAAAITCMIARSHPSIGIPVIALLGLKLAPGKVVTRLQMVCGTYIAGCPINGETKVYERMAIILAAGVGWFNGKVAHGGHEPLGHLVLARDSKEGRKEEEADETISTHISKQM